MLNPLVIPAPASLSLTQYLPMQIARMNSLSPRNLRPERLPPANPVHRPCSTGATT